MIESTATLTELSNTLAESSNTLTESSNTLVANYANMARVLQTKNGRILAGLSAQRLEMRGGGGGGGVEVAKISNT